MKKVVLFTLLFSFVFAPRQAVAANDKWVKFLTHPATMVVEAVALAAGVTISVICKKKVINKFKKKVRFIKELEKYLGVKKLSKELLRNQDSMLFARRHSQKKLLYELIVDYDNIESMKNKYKWANFGFWGGIFLSSAAGLALVSSIVALVEEKKKEKAKEKKIKDEEEKKKLEAQKIKDEEEKRKLEEKKIKDEEEKKRKKQEEIERKKREAAERAKKEKEEIKKKFEKEKEEAQKIKDEEERKRELAEIKRRREEAEKELEKRRRKEQEEIEGQKREEPEDEDPFAISDEEKERQRTWFEIYQRNNELQRELQEKQNEEFDKAIEESREYHELDQKEECILCCENKESKSDIEWAMLGCGHIFCVSCVDNLRRMRSRGGYDWEMSQEIQPNSPCSVCRTVIDASKIKKSGSYAYLKKDKQKEAFEANNKGVDKQDPPSHGEFIL